MRRANRMRSWVVGGQRHLDRACACRAHMQRVDSKLASPNSTSSPTVEVIWISAATG